MKFLSLCGLLEDGVKRQLCAIGVPVCLFTLLGGDGSSGDITARTEILKAARAPFLGPQTTRAT
jgi:hypothetical protein